MENNANQQAAPSAYNLDYFKTPAGILRTAEAALSLCGIISGTIGSQCGYYGGPFGFFLFAVFFSFVEAILIIVLFVFRLESKIPTINIPLTLLINDSISLFIYFVASLLMMLSIGYCLYMVTARVFASLFSIATFLALVGLVYIDFSWWKEIQPKTNGQQTSGTTVTESSPTVLT